MLLEHIYTNNEQMVSKVQVFGICISDHFPVVCTWSSKIARKLAKDHTTIQYRSFKHFNQDEFLQDLNSAPLLQCLVSQTHLKRYQSGMRPFFLS